MGIRTEANLVQNQYNLLGKRKMNNELSVCIKTKNIGTIFYVGYLAAQPIASRLMQHLPLGTYVNP